ncbi:MAG TPA: hypothetical protein VFH70_07250 [Acidimicrobiales bacterium]|nr:hypothetical protein [Acidimicrobiales bacterium]
MTDPRAHIASFGDFLTRFDLDDPYEKDAAFDGTTDYATALVRDLLASPERKDAITTAYLQDLLRLPAEFATGIVTSLACMSQYALLAVRRVSAAGAPAALTRSAGPGLTDQQAAAYRQWVGLVLTVEPDQPLAIPGLPARFPTPTST